MLFLAKLFFGKKGGGAFLNDQPMHVNGKADIDYAFGYCARVNRRPRSTEYAKAISWLLLHTTARISNYGSVFALCYLANGGMDFFIGNGGFDYDYFAPVLIATEAGVMVTDTDGKAWQPGRNDLIAANPILHPKILKVFQESLKQ